MKILPVFLISLVIISCDTTAEEKRETIDTTNLVLDVKSLTFSELPSSIKSKSTNAYVLKSVGEESEEIIKEDGFYLRLTVNNKLLAKSSTDNGMWKEADLLDTSNLNGLYGKYRNYPALYNASGQQIQITRKHEGYDLIKIIRQDNIDTSYWGPLNERPERLVLYCSNLDTASYPRLKVQK